MALSSGQKLGHYEIVAALGAGGMGEVYKATDTRLERTVAIKILPSHVALSEDMRARFQREARTISSLNHPHICTLHDVGHEDGVDFLVMEYIEGQTLAQRLESGPLGTEETLRIAIQVADALDKAHRQGLVHRDLKPGNIMLTGDGAKLLDFGLAKSGPSGVAGESATRITMTMSTPLTVNGTIVGTIQYMAPEALEGVEADARSDIFAFGALLYEMTTGQKAFTGKSQASLIASILKEQPAAVTQLQPLVPPMLEQVIDQCLAKDPDQRWQTAGDLKRALAWIAQGGSQAGVPVTVSRRRKRRETVLWSVIGVLVLGAAFLGWTAWRLAQREVQVVRSNIQLPEGTELWDYVGGMAELSPDGTRLAYVARDSLSEAPRLWVRPLESLEGLPLPGTDYASFPFWSPDGRYIGFFAEGKLRKILATGGPALTLCEAPSGRGGSWNADGEIVFSPSSNGILQRIPAAGGTAVACTGRDSVHGDYTHRWPHFLPDGRSFLFFARTLSDAGGEDDAICLGSLDSPEVIRLERAKSNAAYSAGQIFFVRENTLMALPFDAGRREVTGDAVPVAERVSTVPNFSRGVFSVSRGLLVYRQGEVLIGSQLEIMGLDGAPIARIGEPLLQFSPKISPDGTRIAVDTDDASQGNVDIWIWDLRRSIRTRLTFDPAMDRTPVWSPDSRQVAYFSARTDSGGVYVKAADGTGAPRLVAAARGLLFPMSWSPDGRYIAYVDVDSGNGDIWVATVDGSEEPRAVVASEFEEWDGYFSPDGRWLALTSKESGREEVYVTPFPGPGGKWQVSTNEGDRPRWSADGTKLYYLDNDDHLNVAEFTVDGDAFAVGAVQTMFELNPSRPGTIYDLFPDGERLLVNHRLGTDQLTRLVLVQNWPQTLR
jgi:Tol biopolymer transport system component